MSRNVHLKNTLVFAKYKPRRASSTVVLYFIEIPYSLCFEQSCARVPCSIASVLSPQRAVPPRRHHPLHEEASFCQVAIGDSNLSGIEKGPRQIGVIWSLLVIKMDLLINVSGGSVVGDERIPSMPPGPVRPPNR
jgi:hypothetical protein